MELVPIIYKILIISGGGFILVLVVSFIASKISKNGIRRQEKAIYKQVIAARYYHPAYQYYDDINANVKPNIVSEEEVENKPKEIRVIRRSNSMGHYDRHTHYIKKAGSSKPRYSIVNKTLITNDEINKSNGSASYKIVYPIDYSRSA